MIVFQRVRMPIEAVRDNDLFFVDVDLVHVATEKIHVTNHFADGIHDIGQIQIAGRDLMQHRCKQEEVLAIHDYDFEARIPALLELQRSVKSAEAAAKNEDTNLGCHIWFVEKAAECLQAELTLPP